MAEFNLSRFLAERASAYRRERAEGKKRLREFAKTVKAAGRALKAAMRPARRGARFSKRSAGRGRAGRGGRTPAVLMKVHRGGLSADRYASAKGQLIDTNLPADAPARMAAWKRDQVQHPRVGRLFVHLSFSRPAGQPLTDHQWRTFIAAQLRAAGFATCKFAAWRHQDTACDHVHVLVSRHRPDGGGLVSDGQSFYRWREATRQAEREADIPAPVPMEKPPASRPASDRSVNAERRARRRGTPSAWVDPRRVRDALARSTTPLELQQQLAIRGVELQVLRNAEGKAVGLLLRNAGADEWLAGSSVDRAFSLARTTAALNTNAEEARQAAQAARYAPRPPQPRPTPQPPRERGG